MQKENTSNKTNPINSLELPKNEINYFFLPAMLHIGMEALERLTDHDLMLKKYIKVKITEKKKKRKQNKVS